jgi:hypothetical protein
MSTEVGLMSLSEELILNIFQHLPDGKSVLNLGGACNRLAAVSLDESIWRRRVKVDFPEVVKYVVASGTANSKGQPGGTAKSGTAGRVAQCSLFVYIVCRPLLRLCRPFMIFFYAQCSSTILFSDPESNRIGYFLAYIENAFYLC